MKHKLPSNSASCNKLLCIWCGSTQKISNSVGSQQRHHLAQDIAAKIGDVLRPYSKGSRVGLDTRDRLQRVLKQTQPIATVDLRPISTQEGPTQNGDSHPEPPVREDPLRLKLSPSWQVIPTQSQHLTITCSHFVNTATLCTCSHQLIMCCVHFQHGIGGPAVYNRLWPTDLQFVMSCV